MEKFTTLNDIAIEGNANIITLRSGKKVITYFDRFSTAQELAEKYNLRVVELYHRDGQDWQVEGDAWTPIQVREEMFGDGARFFTESDRDDEFAFFKSQLAKIDDFDEMRERIDKEEKFFDLFDELEDGQAILSTCDHYYASIIEVSDAAFVNYDVHTRAIGLMEKD